MVKTQRNKRTGRRRLGVNTARMMMRVRDKAWIIVVRV